MFDYFIKPKTYSVTEDGLYSQFNQWGKVADSWLVRFLRHNFPNNTRKVAFFGPLRFPFLLRRDYGMKKVFYTPEDVDHVGTKLWLYYRNCGLPYVDLGMGFKKTNRDKYMRLPYWITTTFAPECSEDDIAATVKAINESHYDKKEECVLICGHDPKGTREMIYDGVKDILNVAIAGKWHNNTRDLWEKYDNNKIAYMKRFVFNICAENDNTQDYVTEKLFDAFMADCIPLYYGSNNDPEPGLINKDAVIFWNRNGDNQHNRDLISRLKNNVLEREEFLHQIKILPAGTEYVIEIFNQLRENFVRILKE